MYLIFSSIHDPVVCSIQTFS